MARALSDKDVSRRAAYLVQGWIKDLPPKEMLGGVQPFLEILKKNQAERGEDEKPFITLTQDVINKLQKGR